MKLRKALVDTCADVVLVLEMRREGWADRTELDGFDRATDELSFKMVARTELDGFGEATNELTLETVVRTLDDLLEEDAAAAAGGLYPPYRACAVAEAVSKDAATR